VDRKWGRHFCLGWRIFLKLVAVAVRIRCTSIALSPCGVCPNWFLDRALVASGASR
jgi:hypothetical protein